MEQKRTRIRTSTAEDGSTEVFAFVMHPMETGLRTDPQTRARIPPHFIQRLSFLLNGREVAVADTGIGLSANPLVSIRLENARRGDKLQVRWSDNLGEQDEEEITIGEAS